MPPRHRSWMMLLGPCSSNSLRSLSTLSVVTPRLISSWSVMRIFVPFSSNRRIIFTLPSVAAMYNAVTQCLSMWRAKLRRSGTRRLQIRRLVRRKVYVCAASSFSAIWSRSSLGRLRSGITSDPTPWPVSTRWR